jgi:pyruvate dehydrogenase E2 component (dihydrolipoamide acetyltransferase)
MATVIELERESDTINEAIVTAFQVAVGDSVERGQVVAEIEADKVTVEVVSPVKGSVLALLVTPGETLVPGAPLVVIGSADEDWKRCLTEWQARVGESPLRPKDSEHATPGEPPSEFIVRPDRRIALSPMRRAIIRRMSQSKRDAPHFYLTCEIDMEAAAAARAKYNLAISGTKVSFNDMLIAAGAKALREHPRVNARFEPDGIVELGDIHIGVAVAVEDGLVVPVIRFADQKTLKQLSIEVRDFGKRAKKKSLRARELEGGTFTISNLGMFGIESFIAVVNPGEGAILAVGQVVEQPAAWHGALTIRKKMKATLSCDHRVIDGAIGAMFLQSFCDFLEHPETLLD